jgi:hypothetical protein
MRKTYHKPTRKKEQTFDDYKTSIRNHARKQGVPPDKEEVFIELMLWSRDGKVHCENGQYYATLFNLKGYGNASNEELLSKLKQVTK